MGDQIYHPQHYNSHPSGVECWDIVRHMNFNLGNAVKYIWRAGLKTNDPIQDLEKAVAYLQDEIVRLKKDVKRGPRTTGNQTNATAPKSQSMVTSGHTEGGWSLSSPREGVDSEGSSPVSDRKEARSALSTECIFPDCPYPHTTPHAHETKGGRNEAESEAVLQRVRKLEQEGEIRRLQEIMAERARQFQEKLDAQQQNAARE